VTTKFVGLTSELEKAKDMGSANQQMHVTAGGMDVGAAIGGLATILDNFLISGMGGAVSIEYAKQAVAVASLHSQAK
jgi:hypothetical protein